MRRSVGFFSRFALVAAAVVVTAVSARADTVVLKNGARFEGRVVSETEQQIVLATRSGEVVLKRTEIAEVVPGPFGEPAEREKDEKAKPPGARPSPAAGKKPGSKAAKAPIPKPPLSKAKGAKTPAKKPPTPKSPPKAKLPSSPAKKPPLSKPTPPKPPAPASPRPAPPVRPTGAEKSPGLPSGVSFEPSDSRG